MNDRTSAFMRHYGKGGFLDNDTTEDDSVYKAWQEGRYGEPVPKLLLVPAMAAGAETWRIPYLQTIVQRYDRQSGQLCLMMPSSELMVFIEGRGLDQLDELLDNRRIRSIHMFDETIHRPIGNDVPVVTNISVEQS